MKETQVLALLKTIQAGRPQKVFAQELGISAPYLSDIYRGNRSIPEKVLGKLGLQREIKYVRAAR